MELYNKKVLFLLSLTPVLANAENVSSSVKKNVIFIAVDDLRPELNCYGANHMFTPNIDEMAKHGVVFNRAYCNIPVSGASRASLMTGTRPTKNTFLNHKTVAEQQKPDKIALNDYLQSLGYRTEVRGKVFHNSNDHKEGWDMRHPSFPPQYLSEQNLKVSLKGRGAPYECMDVHDTVYAEGKRVLAAIKDLERLSKSGQPFFYGLGFIKPHLPFTAPKRYWDMYEGKVQLPDNYKLKEGNAIPAKAFHNWGELRTYYGVPKSGPVSDEEALKLIQGYRACVSYVDALIGKLMDEIKRIGLDKNTIIVLWGDHGWSLGEHGLWCKHTILETMLHSPLIIVDPTVKLNGKSCNEVVEFVDIFPTVCEAIGVGIPEQCEGESLYPLMNDDKIKSKGYAVSRWGQGYTLVTDDNFFYTEWWDEDKRAVERMLFDHNLDPHENFNVVSDIKYKNRIKEMREQLKKCIGADFDKY